MTSIDKENWSRVKKRLRGELGEDVFSQWFERMELDGSEEDTVKLSVPTLFLKNWIEAHYCDQVLSCWQAENFKYSRVEFIVRSSVIRSPWPRNPPAAIPAAPREPHDLRTISSAHDLLGGSPLDPRLTFENFIVGRCNTLAHAAARQVAMARYAELAMFNPLYVHAPPGAGKTHLFQALAWVGNATRDRKVLYLTAEKFMYGFVSGLRAQNAPTFKESLRSIDVLVIDDLQFLQGKSTQAAFYRTLDALSDSGRQVVIAADRPPSDLETVEKHVRSRLAGGLVVEMAPLGETMRLEILHSRAAAAKQDYSSFEMPVPVLAYIAKSATLNGHDLERVVSRLLAHSKLTGQPVTLEMAEREMRDQIRRHGPTSAGNSTVRLTEHPTAGPNFGNVFVLGKTKAPAKASSINEQRDGKPLHYTVSGLDDVYLVNGFTIESIDGEDHVSIEDLDGLWKAIGLDLVTTRKSLAPKEIRFLRQHMGLTQVELAAKLRVTGQSVARWEKGVTDPGPADLLVRVQFLASKIAQPEGEQLLPKLVKLYDEMSHRDDMQDKPVVFERGKKQWKKL